MSGARNPARGATAGDIVALRGATLVDVSNFGRSRADVPNAVVVVREGGDVVAAGAASDVRIPPDARVIDVTGKFVVPGLHDVFATINNQAQANAFLYMGVTSIVGLDEPGGRRGPLSLRVGPGPRIHRLDEVTGYDAGALGSPYTSIKDLRARATPLDERALVRQVDELARSGVKVLLLYYSLSPEQTRIVARRAREIGLATIGELGHTSYSEGIAAGVQAFVHTGSWSCWCASGRRRARRSRRRRATWRRSSSGRPAR